ncbi:uncharacterized protein LOC122243768 [Penaeus japonicus]|uniref:uncharacterized protein LOC122243768 n=1 Tax=Penaeus japonicus TaxID=27405 RepID=UPI001C70D67C|nr:uncharacterized protein LOC122243768 [Penaeus japonicus]XP_042857395.1 uncharacterized protein LOC122243768 [Penaeus japonicus]
MAKLFPVFLVASVVSVQLCASIRCYTCVGYNSSLPTDDLTNNPYCVSENFTNTEVQTREASYGFCHAMTVRTDAGELTKRVGDIVLLNQRSYIYHLNYLCNADLCNDKPTNSAGTPSLLWFLLVPALLSRLLA